LIITFNFIEQYLLGSYLHYWERSYKTKLNLLYTTLLTSMVDNRLYKRVYLPNKAHIFIHNIYKISCIGWHKYWTN